MHHVIGVLNRKRPVETPFVTERLDVIRGGPLAEEGVDRIARSVESQGKCNERPDEESRDEKQKPTENVATHYLRSRIRPALGVPSRQMKAAKNLSEDGAYAITGHDPCQSTLDAKETDP